MSSMEIAELTGKPHSDLMKAIRLMEEAWVNVGQGNFSLTYYIDRSNRKQTQYELNKKECLYIATKFNDEARAKLIIRWEQLETQHHLPKSFAEALMLAAKKEEELEQKEHLLHQKDERLQLQEYMIEKAAPKVECYEEVLQSESAYNTTQIAKELGMTATSLNRKLHESAVFLRSGKKHK